MIQRTRGSIVLTACSLSQVIWMQFTNSRYVAIQMPNMIQSRFYSIKLQTIFFTVLKQNGVIDHCTTWLFPMEIHLLRKAQCFLFSHLFSCFPWGPPSHPSVTINIDTSSIFWLPQPVSPCSCSLHLFIFFNHLKAKTALAYATPSITTEWVQLYYLDETLATQPHQTVVSCSNIDQQQS